MADTDPSVEAAKVLRRHVTSVRWARSLGITHLGAVYLDTCSCSWNDAGQADREDTSGSSSILRRAQHQADMLAAAGLLRPTPCCPPSVEQIYGHWLVETHTHHTCGAGGADGHEPGCGLVPLVDLAGLKGWDSLVEYVRDEAAGIEAQE